MFSHRASPTMGVSDFVLYPLPPTAATFMAMRLHAVFVIIFVTIIASKSDTNTIEGFVLPFHHFIRSLKTNPSSSSSSSSCPPPSSIIHLSRFGKDNSNRMKAPPWCSDDTGCPILKRPNTKTLAETYSTIDEIPTSNLIDGKELALVLLLDMSKQQILFQIPNTKLNWRYHYGCQLNINSLESKQMKTDPRRSSAGAPEEETEEACKKEIQEGLLQRNDIAIQSLRKAGMMLFSFPTIKKPMRVHVFEASVDSSSSSGGGVWTKFSDIPYTEMWADDILWLPWFVNQEEEKKQQVSFQGHFIFDGSPGPTSKLVEHNCQRY